MRKLLLFIAVLFSLSLHAQVPGNTIRIKGNGLSVSDTALMWAAHPKQDTTYRTLGKDSIQFTINGRYHAIKDSTGATANQAIGAIGYSENGGGNIIVTGSKGFITIPYDCTITKWYVASNISGTIQFDIKRSGTSIVGAGNKPALSSALSANATPSSWTSVAVTAGDILEWVVDASPAPASLTQVSVVLKVTK